MASNNSAGRAIGEDRTLQEWHAPLELQAKQTFSASRGSVWRSFRTWRRRPLDGDAMLIEAAAAARFPLGGLVVAGRRLRVAGAAATMLGGRPHGGILHSVDPAVDPLPDSACLPAGIPLLWRHFVRANSSNQTETGGCGGRRKATERQRRSPDAKGRAGASAPMNDLQLATQLLAQARVN